MKRDRIETLKANAKLDVRLPDQLKDEFLARCREEGVSSGAVIRSLIIGYVLDRPRRWSTRLSWLKEAMMKRFRWTLGAAGAAAVAAMSAAALVFAPTASAEDVHVDFELTIETGGDGETFSGSHVTELGQVWLILPSDESGTVRYALNMSVRGCTDTERAADVDCELMFDVEFFEVLAYDDNQWSGVNITEKRPIANPQMSGELGQTLNYFSVIEDGDSTLTFKTLATVS